MAYKRQEVINPLFLGVAEAAAMIHRSDETVRKLCDSGKLKAVRIGAHGARAIFTASVERYLRGRESESSVETFPDPHSTKSAGK